MNNKKMYNEIMDNATRVYSYTFGNEVVEFVTCTNGAYCIKKINNEINKIEKL